MALPNYTFEGATVPDNSCNSEEVKRVRVNVVILFLVILYLGLTFSFLLT